MVGRDVRVVPRVEVSSDDVVLEVRNLSRLPMIKDVSFSLVRGFRDCWTCRSGENGNHESAFGADLKTSGEIFIEGEKVEIQSPNDAVKMGIGFVPG